MRRFVASCSVVLIAIAAFAACGGGSSKSPASSGTQAGTTSPAGNGSTNSDLAKLYADAAKARFKITYTSGNGSAPQTYAQDGKGNSVYGSADSQYFTSASGSVSCNTDSNGKATCLQVPGGATVNPFLTLFQAGKSYIDALGGRYGDVSSKTIAGRDAKCVTISAKSIAGVNGIKGSATYCIDKGTGVLLEISGTDASGKDATSLTVTKFEEPTDSDFTPPATPSSVPGYTVPGQ